MMHLLRLVIWTTNFTLLCSEAVGLPPSRDHRGDRATVAVLNFEAVGQPAARERWAVGLADFMAASLADRGVATLERRELTYILSERRLQRQARLSPREIVLAKLPWVRFLLVGEVTPHDAGGFDLSVSLVDTKNGHDVLRERVVDAYPKDVAHGLIELADKVAARLGLSRDAVPKRAAQPGFTTIPEVALVFYRGLDWLMVGRPEFAEQYFRLAGKMDPTFPVASLWRAKAFRNLGLADFAQPLYERLSKDAPGRSLLKSMGSGISADSDQLVVSVIAPRDRKARDSALEDSLSRALIADPHIHLFEPRRIPKLSNEVDLALTGEFDDRYHPLGVTLVADMFVSVERADTSLDAVATIRMAMVDATTGALMASGSRPLSQSASVEKDCLELFRELVSRCGGQASAQQSIGKLRPLDYGPASPVSGLVRLGQRYAYYLRDYAGDPSNRRKLINLVATQDSIYDYRLEEAAILRRILANRLLNLIDEEDSEEVNWLSQALWWTVRSKKYLKSNGLFVHTPDNYIEETLQPLVQRHLHSWPTFYAQMAIAVERAVTGKHVEAAELLETLVARLPEFSDRLWPESCKANLYFFAAREAHVVGKNELAFRFITEAQSEIRRCPLDERFGNGFHLFGVMASPYANVPYSSGARFEGGNSKMATRLPWNPEPLGFIKYQLFNTQGYGVNTTLTKEIDNLHRLLQGDANSVSLKDIYARARVSTGMDGVKTRFAYLNRLYHMLDNGEPVETQHIGYNTVAVIQWLADLAPRQRLAELHQIVRKLADALADRQQLRPFDQLRERLRLFMAAAMYKESLELTAEGLLSPRVQQRYDSVLIKAKVLLATGGIDPVALFLDGELRRFEQDFKKPYSFEYASLVMRCAWAYRTSGKPAEALRLYQRGMDEPLKGPTTEHTQRYKVSMVYQAARMNERLGHFNKAASLFKRVIDSPHGQALSLLDGNTLGSVPVGKLAVEHLERLRGNRKNLSRTRIDAPIDQSLKIASACIESGDVATGIQLLYFIIYRVEGSRWDLTGGLNGDEDYALGLLAKTRLKALRVEHSHAPQH